MLQTLTDVDGTLLGSSQADGSARTSGVMEEEKPQQIVLLNYVTDDLAKLVTVYNPGLAEQSCTTWPQCSASSTLSCAPVQSATLYHSGFRPWCESQEPANQTSALHGRNFMFGVSLCT